MKFVIMLALVFAPAATRAQNSSTPQGSSDEIKRDLIELEKNIGRANFTCDYAFFSRVEADELIFTEPNGSVITKQEDLAGEKDCHKSDTTFDLDDTKVQLYGNVAVVTAHVTLTGKDKEGKPFTRHSRFTDVFVWRDGRWQLVAGQSTNIPDAKAS